jgi:lipopolysaccharide export system protein LptA
VSANLLTPRHFAVAIAGALFFGLPAYAEKADRDKPIHLEADRVTVDDAKQIATFTGNVVLTQGTMVMRGDRMEVRQDKQGFRQGVMWGNLAYFRQKREGFDEHIEGWAERVEYDGRADKVQMYTRAMLKRGQDEVRGNYISYDANTEFFQVNGGGSKSVAAKSGDERVRVILQPKPKDAKPSAPAVPLKMENGAETTRGDAGGGRK